MEIQIISPSDLPIANIIIEVLKRSIIKHPLINDVLKQQLRSNLIISIEIINNGFNCGPTIDCSQYPKIKMQISINRYMQGAEFDESLFFTEMLHEWTHLTDRLDQSFGLTNEKELYAKCISKGFIPEIWMDLWNLYINGRLERSGNRIQSFQQFKLERFGRRLNRGNIQEADLKPYENAFKSNRMTFNDIIRLSKMIKGSLSN